MFRSRKKNSTNDGHKTDPILICFSILRAVGCWAIESKISFLRVLYKLYQYLVLAGFTILPILEIIYMINVRHDLDKLNYTLTASSGTIMLIFKISEILQNRLRLIELQEDLADGCRLPYVGKSEEDRKIMNNYDDTSTKILKIYYIYLGIPAVTMWCLIPLIDKQDGEKILPMSIWLPFDYQVTPVYELLWAFQCFMLYMYCGAIITTDQMVFCFLPKFCAQYDILKKNLRYLSSRYENRKQLIDPPQSEAATYKSLTQITIHHDALLRLCQKLESIYYYIIFIHFFGIAVLMCTTIFDVAMVPKSKLTLRFAQQIQYFTAGLIDTYIFCYHGNRLIIRGDEFAQELYAIPWYHMSPRCKKLLLQMMLHAKKPFQMSGAGRFFVNHELFQAVMKLTYNILALLENMQNSQ